MYRLSLFRVICNLTCGVGDKHRAECVEVAVVRCTLVWGSHIVGAEHLLGERTLVGVFKSACMVLVHHFETVVVLSQPFSLLVCLGKHSLYSIEFNDFHFQQIGIWCKFTTNS